MTLIRQQPNLISLEAQLQFYDLLSRDQQVSPITNSGYGIGERDKFCTEETPLRPISTYGRHKVEVETRAISRENTISFRLATVFGMAQRMGVKFISQRFCIRAVNDRALILFEAQFKNYIHNKDVANAFHFALSNFENMRSEIFNLGLSDANL